MTAAPAPAPATPPPPSGQWLARYPWLRLFSIATVGLSARMLILGAIGTLLLWEGWRVLDRAFDDGIAFHRLVDWREHRPPWPSGASSVGEAAALAASPIRAPMEPVFSVLSIRATWWARAHGLVAAIWGIAVLGLAGGGMARIAVAHASTGERVGIRSALRFAASRATALVATPLLPFFAVAFLAVGCAALGLLFRADSDAADAVASALLPLPLLAGLVMAILLIGLAACWPLMITAVAAEGEDTFEAFSRSYNYVLYRPLTVAALALLAWGIATLALLFVGFFAGAVVHLAHWGLALGAGEGRGDQIVNLSRGAGVYPSSSIHSGWLSVVHLLTYAATWGLFWSAVAIIYLTMRLAVDGDRWHSICRDRREPKAAPGVEKANAPAADSAAGAPELGPPPAP